MAENFWSVHQNLHLAHSGHCKSNQLFSVLLHFHTCISLVLCPFVAGLAGVGYSWFLGRALRKADELPRLEVRTFLVLQVFMHNPASLWGLRSAAKPLLCLSPPTSGKLLHTRTIPSRPARLGLSPEMLHNKTKIGTCTCLKRELSLWYNDCYASLENATWCGTLFKHFFFPSCYCQLQMFKNYSLTLKITSLSVKR